MTAPSNIIPRPASKAIPKTARVIAVDAIAADTRHLTLEMTAPAELGFAGGQYVIIDTGIVLPSGKVAKRAYSILSADAQQSRFELAALRLPEGPGSGFLHAQVPGAEIRFSGPWGKLHLTGCGAPIEEALAPPLTLALATDTGVTAILGLVRSGWFAPLVAGCTFVWLRTAADYFLPESFVRARLPAGLRIVEIAELPPAGDPARIPLCQQRLQDVTTGGNLWRAFVAGDGAVNYALLDDLVIAGVPATRDSVESFFNMPKKADVQPVGIMAAPLPPAGERT
jgi:ferredoxin-NADP reductase